MKNEKFSLEHWNNSYKNKRSYKKFFKRNPRYQKKDLEQKSQTKDDPKIEEITKDVEELTTVFPDYWE